jgi:hypothetical protein
MTHARSVDDLSYVDLDALLGDTPCMSDLDFIQDHAHNGLDGQAAESVSNKSHQSTSTDLGYDSTPEHHIGQGHGHGQGQRDRISSKRLRHVSEGEVACNGVLGTQRNSKTTKVHWRPLSGSSSIEALSKTTMPGNELEHVPTSQIISDAPYGTHTSGSAVESHTSNMSPGSRMHVSMALSHDKNTKLMNRCEVGSQSLSPHADVGNDASDNNSQMQLGSGSSSEKISSTRGHTHTHGDTNKTMAEFRKKFLSHIGKQVK